MAVLTPTTSTLAPRASSTPLSALTVQRHRLLLALVADAPTGIPCPSCHQLHDTAEAELDCVTGGAAA